MYEIPDEIVAAAQRADYEWSRTRKADGRNGVPSLTTRCGG